MWFGKGEKAELVEEGELEGVAWLLPHPHPAPGPALYRQHTATKLPPSPLKLNRYTHAAEPS